MGKRSPRRAQIVFYNAAREQVESMTPVDAHSVAKGPVTAVPLGLAPFLSSYPQVELAEVVPGLLLGDAAGEAHLLKPGRRMPRARSTGLFESQFDSLGCGRWPW